MAIDDERERIGRTLFCDAANKRDPAPIIARLAEIGVDGERIDELAELVRHAGALIQQRPDPAGQARRDNFLDELCGSACKRDPVSGVIGVQ